MNGPSFPPESGPHASGDPGSPHRGPQDHDPGELGALALGLLDPDRTRAVEEHLATCGYCRRCYQFEVSFRRVVKKVLAEPMPADLKQRLLDLRTPL